MLFLDKRNALIADEAQQTGTADHTPVYPRELVKRALELSATAMALVHKKPARNPTRNVNVCFKAKRTFSDWRRNVG